MIRLNVARDANASDRIPALRFSSNINVIVLGGGFEDTIIVPDGARVAVFRYHHDAEVWMRVNDTAVIPVASIVDGTASEYKPDARQVIPGDNIHMVSVNDTSVSIAFYS